jgi:hypothetical protein
MEFGRNHDFLPPVLKGVVFVCEVIENEGGEGDGCDEGDESVSRPCSDELCSVPSSIGQTIAISTWPCPIANVFWHPTVTSLQHGPPKGEEIDFKGLPL